MLAQQTPQTLETSQDTPFSLALSPAGHIYIHKDSETQEFMPPELAGKVQDLLESGSDIGISALGLLRFAITNYSASLPSSLAFWQRFGQLFVHEARQGAALNDGVLVDDVQIHVPDNELQVLHEQAPFMRGSEYLTVVLLTDIWQELTGALKQELAPFQGKLQDYLAAHNPAWSKVGRVCFHLAENKSNPAKPFAFLATYTVQLSAESSLQHLPLGRALKDYAGEQKRSQLLSLLLPVQKAAEQSDFIKKLVNTKAIFQPIAWGSKQAHAFLKAIPQIEAAGVMVRVPNWWRPKTPPRPKVEIEIGNASSSMIGLGALLDFSMSYSLPNGDSLSYQEMQDLLRSSESLVQIRGQWVEVDAEKLSDVLSHWKQVEGQVRHEGLSFAQGLRMLASAPGQAETDTPTEDVIEWSSVVEGKWLHDALDRLRNPEHGQDQQVQEILQTHLNATLREYQSLGVQWLWWLYNLQLGGCLADDMGLGKTIQVLSLLLLIKHQKIQNKKPHLLVLPASLMGNWQAEINRFAPSLNVWVAHSSQTRQEQLKRSDAPDLSRVDLVITTYGNVHRLAWMKQVSWDLVVLDEAQSIKNPTTKQTQAVKALSSQVRFILTGTPIENRLLDLWSLFDFVAPGLLGSSKIFSNYGKKMRKQHEDGSGEGRFYSAIRHLITPYILRRLKSDKSIISDLPDKTEMDTFCFLSKQQAGLYQKSVQELEEKLKENEFNDDIKRRGLVLAYLTRFKQICNHPSQWLGHGEYAPQASGKFLRLKELCTSIAAKQEKVLVFTQYKEIIPAIHGVLEEVFGRSGLTLHGQTPVKERPRLVDLFQSEQGPPFFVLSIKAGGSGLNLTRASHVIHFDRWWNPAVENQATDRAYRIGQKKNVLVHKFICQGTIEEKIDQLINSKKELAEDILAKGGGAALTEMNNEELLSAVSLDIHRAVGDS
ncbi:MAG: DEAD/DEAH box helicase [Pseudomonadota bacterium]